MGGVDVGGGGNKRSLNVDLNLVPFVDLLMVTVAFLLVTAVWSQQARIEANAEVPGKAGCGEDCQDEQRVLHVHVEDQQFKLQWKQGKTVVTEKAFERVAIEVGEGENTAVQYPGLAQELEQAWREHGAHRDVGDQKQDLAVLHTSNTLPFREIVGVLDAVVATKRNMARDDGNAVAVAAFNPVFSVR